MKHWRDDDNKLQNKISNIKSSHTSISPSKFYRKKRNNKIMKSKQQIELDQLLQGVSDRTKAQSIHKCYIEIRNKRIAYKSITSLKKFPLQDCAMEYWNNLLLSYLFPTSITKTVNANPSLLHEVVQKKEGYVSSSTTSSVSNINNRQQKKRVSLDGSPVKVAALCPRIKEELANEFLVERDMINPSNFMKSKYESSEGDDENVEIKNNNSHCNENNDNDTNNNNTFFLPALWSLEPRIFAMEMNSSGKRKYIVGHYGRFIDYYWRKTSAEARHYYELIPEKTPCRLFFDLEFNKQANPNISSTASSSSSSIITEDLMTEFIEELIIEIKNIYDLTIDRSCIVDLDSSTNKKFSRHLIVHSPNHSLFANATEAGIFVKHFISRLADEVATNKLDSIRPTLSKYLFVNKEKVNDNNDTNTLFVDLGVYTRNRLFRLMGSTKFGKTVNAALRIADANQFPFPSNFHNHKFYIPEMKKKCNNSNDQTSNNSTDENDDNSSSNDVLDGKISEVDQFRSSMDWSDHADALASTLVVPLNYSKTNYNLLDTSQLTINNKSRIASKKSRVASSKHQKANTRAGYRSTLSLENRGPSPFIELDKYVNDVLAAYGGVQGQIRCWYINNQFSSQNSVAMSSYGSIESITYHISHNRYCENIGRCHKSNGIMWTVDFLQMHCYQSCWDPECKSMGFYRSKPVDLPLDVMGFVREKLFDIEIASLDESTFDKRSPSSSQQEEPFKLVKQKAEIDDKDVEFEKALLAIDLSDLTKNMNSEECKENIKSSSTENSIGCQKSIEKSLQINECEHVDSVKNREEFEFEEALLKLNI